MVVPQGEKKTRPQADLGRSRHAERAGGSLVFYLKGHTFYFTIETIILYFLGCVKTIKKVLLLYYLFIVRIEVRSYTRSGYT